MSAATRLYIDLESRSAVDLKKAGAHVYWADPSTDLWCACWALDDGPVSTWTPRQSCPAPVAAHIRSGGIVSGWNVGFERLGFEHRLGPTYGWPVPDPLQYDDTAAAAAAMGLPRDLGGASLALGLDVTKDMDGKALMMRMSRPRKKEIVRASTAWSGAPEDKPENWEEFYAPFTEETRYVWWDDDEMLERLAAYCVVDVRTERAARARLMPLSRDEMAIWHLDARINARGIAIDRELAGAMIDVVDQSTTRLNAEMVEATGGAVRTASQVAALTAWLQENGVAAESLAKAALSELLTLDDVPPHCRRALEIRKEAAKASTAKLKAAMACTGEDGRARGLMLYHGAATGRWSGRLFQPHNLPRGSGVVKNAEAAAQWMLQRDADLISVMYGAPLSAVSDCLRSVIHAAPGHDLLAADFSAIEGRVTAWLAGEESELQAYRANDAGTGAGLYEITAAGIFNRDVATIGKKSIERQIGKVAVLALGYAGGVNAFYSMAKNYPDVNMELAFEPVWAAADDERREKAEKRYARCLRRREAGTDKMSRNAWLASELTKIGWRATHPATVAAWAALEDGAREATMVPGTVVQKLRCSFVVAKGFLWMRLPSGRCLAYGMPRVKQQVWARRRLVDRDAPFGTPLPDEWDDDSEIMAKDAAEALAVEGLVRIERPAKAAVTALGVNSTTRKWERFALYSGLIYENAVQAIARDVMAEAMLRAERAGYPIVLTVHDEIVAEPRKGFGNVAEFERLICRLPDWAEGLPLAASGWRGERYRKD